MNRYENAKAAITAMFADTSVPPEETAANLRDLRDHCATLLETLNAD